MTTFKVFADFERPEHAGASGMYQIEMLLKNGEDVTSQIDQGMMFHEEDERKDLTEYLSQVFGIPKHEISYDDQRPEDHPDWPFK
ncbi:hypothetical protein [uncultured Desulfovibrio sp.]|uniref:hypothetical protein n=1 Tax=uncultured Desulfovibrio sp. TaxID=167968 RepID=UPI002616CE2D|nr:hypothetical protein [uncultured Desulfovibrio sp.]